MIRAEGLSFRVGEISLVESAHMGVTKGEVVALLGPNGAGKSTLLKLLCGQLSPNEGQVFFENKPLAEWEPRELARRRAVLPQSSTVPFDFTALEIVLLGRSPHGDASRCEDMAREAMAQTECAHLAERIVTSLSGGEMQRVQLARVLVQIDWAVEGSPRCVMLDEPISNLDPGHQHGALRVAAKLAEKGVGVLVVLHDLNLAAQYADRLLLMKQGRIVVEGTPAEVITEEQIGAVFDIRVKVIRNPTCDAPAVFVESSV